jgi:HEAT repeat protein
MKRVWIISGFSALVFMASISFADQVDDLITQLKDPDPLVQCQAIEQLGQLKDKRATEPLIALITGTPTENSKTTPSSPSPTAPADPAAEKVEQAKRACAGGDKHIAPTMTTDPATLKQLIAKMRTSRDFTGKTQAAEDLGKTKDKRAVDVLLQVLREQDFGQLHSKVIEALGNIGDTKAVPALIKRLQSSDNFSGKAVAIALGKIGDPRATEPLYKAMTTVDFFQTDGAEALVQLGGADAVKYLNKAAGSENAFIKQAVEKALGSLGPDHGLKPLTDLLKDADPKVRSMAAAALTDIGDSTVEFDLQEALDGLDEQTRNTIRQKLTQNQTNQATAVYDSALEANVRIAAIEALGQVTDPKAVRALLAALQDKDPAVCKAAGRALAAYQSKTVIRPIEITLNNRDTNVVKQAIKDLGWIGSDYAVELIGKYISNTFVNREAISALGNSENPKAIPYLETAMQSTFTQDEAIEAVLKIHHPDARKVILKGLSVNSFQTQKKVVEEIGRWNDPSTIEPLIESFKQNNSVTQEQVIDILKKFNDPRVDAAFGEALDNPFQKDKLLAILKERNWQPQTTRQKVLYYMACKEWDKCAQLGPEAADMLLDKFKKSGSNDIAKVLNTMKETRAYPIMLDFIKKWRGSQEILAGALKTGWEPQTLEEKIQVAVCKDGAEFMQLWKDPKVKEYFTTNLNSDNNIALTVISLSIRYKLTEMVGPMINRFNSINDENIRISVCNQFLGSHNKALYDVGKQWAQSKNLRIIEFGFPGGGGW